MKRITLRLLLTLTLSLQYLNSEAGNNIPMSQIKELTPCQASQLARQLIITERTIPIFNSELFAIQFKSDTGLTIRATDPSLSQFLVCYYTSASRTIGQSEGSPQRVRNGMLLTFNLNYLKFLNNYGVPLICISFYAGTTTYFDVIKVQELAEKIEKKFGQANTGHGSGSGSRSGQSGVVSKDSDFVNKLGLTVLPYIEVSPSIPPGTYNPTCDSIFLKLQDGSVLTNLPKISIPLDTIKIPGQGTWNTDTVNVTLLLFRYLSTGINCLESNNLRVNFSSSLSNWMKAKLLPVLLGSSNCFNGFPGILTFTKSVELYSVENFRRVQSEDVKVNDMKRDRSSSSNIPDAGNPYVQPYNGYQRQPPPPPEFKNVYYGEPPEESDLEGGEYAVLHGQQPEVIQNEVYKVPSRLTYQIHEEQTTQTQTVTSNSLLGSLAAGVSSFAVLLIILVFCLFPFIYWFLKKGNDPRKPKERLKKWMRDHFQLDERVSSDESSCSGVTSALIKGSRKHSKSKNKTLVNIKVNETPIAEVSIDEVETESSSRGESDEELSYISEASFIEKKKKGSRNDHEKKRNHSDRIKKIPMKQKKPKTDDYVRPRSNNTRQTLPIESDRRMKRFSLPLPTSDDFKPPPLPFYEKSKSFELQPLEESQPWQSSSSSQSSRTFSKNKILLEDKKSSYSYDRNYPGPGRAVKNFKRKEFEPLLLRKSSDNFYQEQMVKWDKT